jgi:hypothetical protein
MDEFQKVKKMKEQLGQVYHEMHLVTVKGGQAGADLPQ